MKPGLIVGGESFWLSSLVLQVKMDSNVDPSRAFVKDVKRVVVKVHFSFLLISFFFHFS